MPSPFQRDPQAMCRRQLSRPRIGPGGGGQEVSAGDRGSPTAHLAPSHGPARRGAGRHTLAGTRLPAQPRPGPATPAPYSKAQSVAGAAQSPRATTGREDACNSSPQHEPARGLRQLPRSSQHALRLARQQCKAGRHHWLGLGALPGASLPQRQAIIAANPGDAACPFQTPTLAGPPAAIPRPQGFCSAPRLRTRLAWGLQLQLSALGPTVHGDPG